MSNPVITKLHTLKDVAEQAIEKISTLESQLNKARAENEKLKDQLSPKIEDPTKPKKPCPWCKSQMLTRSGCLDESMNGLHQVFCPSTECPVKPNTPWYQTIEEAVSAWDGSTYAEETEN